MPIQVVCPGCHKRFKVSDQFAGQTGACPNCKAVIRVPGKSDEVVVHAPEQYGPKDAGGRPVLKPLEREYAELTPLAWVGIAVGVTAMFGVALFLRGSSPSFWILGGGALVLAPPIVLGGYSFLRNQELESYSGASLALRVAACSLVYVIIWGLLSGIHGYLLGADPLEIWQMAFILPAMVGLGAFASHTALDLEPLNACLHYGLFLLLTVLLRLTMGLSVLVGPFIEVS